jgi:hypothetical protein
MAEALYLSGRKIDWSRPPKPGRVVKWSRKDQYGREIHGSFRTICHMNRLNNIAKKRFGREIVVIQPPYNRGVRASAGTHDYSECWDVYIPGVSWWRMQRFFRANGFACWYRHPPLFGNHIHGFSLPPREGRVLGDDWKVLGIKVGKYVDGGWSLYGRPVTSSQIEDYYNRAFGLYQQHQAGSDHSWFPKSVEKTIFDLDAYIARRVPKPKVVKK